MILSRPFPIYLYEERSAVKFWLSRYLKVHLYTVVSSAYIFTKILKVSLGRSLIYNKTQRGQNRGERALRDAIIDLIRKDSGVASCCLLPCLKLSFFPLLRKTVQDSNSVTDSTFRANFRYTILTSFQALLKNRKMSLEIMKRTLNCYVAYSLLCGS